MAALAAGEATGITDVLAAVTPGGGKSLLPVIAGAHLIRAGVVERICWAVPRDSFLGSTPARGVAPAHRRGRAGGSQGPALIELGTALMRRSDLLSGERL